MLAPQAFWGAGRQDPCYTPVTYLSVDVIAKKGRSEKKHYYLTSAFGLVQFSP